LHRDYSIYPNAWTPDEEQVIIDHLGKKNKYQLAEILDRSPEAIRARITKIRKQLRQKAA
jgi:hypothetical protein